MSADVRVALVIVAVYGRAQADCFRLCRNLRRRSTIHVIHEEAPDQLRLGLDDGPLVGVRNSPYPYVGPLPAEPLCHAFRLEPPG